MEDLQNMSYKELIKLANAKQDELRLVQRAIADHPDKPKRLVDLFLNVPKDEVNSVKLSVNNYLNKFLKTKGNAIFYSPDKVSSLVIAEEWQKGAGMKYAHVNSYFNDLVIWIEHIKVKKCKVLQQKDWEEGIRRMAKGIG